jgi:hypothetical protein
MGTEVAVSPVMWTDIAMLIVTSIAAGVVAWQAWETRKSAKASEDAVTMANEALKVAQSEELNTRDLIAEAVRLRIDSATPELLIKQKSIELLGSGLPPEDIRTPRDANADLTIRVYLAVTNNSDSVIEVACESTGRVIVPSKRLEELDSEELRLAIIGHEYRKPFSIEPHDYRDVFIQVVRPVKEWIAVTEWLSKSSKAHDMEAFQSSHGFSRDANVVFSWSSTAETGAWDIYRSWVSGSPLESYETDTGPAWRVAMTPDGRIGTVNWGPELRERRYFLSRSSGLQLPSGPRMTDTGLFPIDHPESE